MRESKPDTDIEKSETGIADRDTAGLSQRQIVLKRFVKHKAALASLITLAFIIVIVYTSLGTNLGFGNRNPRLASCSFNGFIIANSFIPLYI
jgi:hypothetical protein